MSISYGRSAKHYGIDMTVERTFKIVPPQHMVQDEPSGRNVRAFLEMAALIAIVIVCCVVMGSFLGACALVFGYIYTAMVAIMFGGLVLLVYKDPEWEDIERSIIAIHRVATATSHTVCRASLST